MKRLFPLIFITVFFLTSCVAYIDSKNRKAESQAEFKVTWNSSVGNKISNLKYEEGSYNKYDLYLPADSTTEQAKHLIMFTHGGGWTGGSKDSGELYCKYFTSKGYVTASIDYTLWDGTQTPSIASLNDELLAAVTAIKAKCSEKGFELTDMATFGYSAGACQSLLYSFTHKDDSPLPVKFCMDWSGPVTFDPAYWSVEAGIYEPELGLLGLKHGSDSEIAAFVEKFSGQNVTVEDVKSGAAEAVWNSISPVFYVKENWVPVIQCYGVYDGIVPVGQQKLFTTVLEENEVPHNTVVFPHSGHGLHCDIDKIRVFKKLADQYCQLYFGIS